MPLLLKSVEPERSQLTTRLLDLRPIFANRRALAYIVGYGTHCWELFAMRSWLVAFLAFSLSLQPEATAGRLSPTSVATISGLLATAASIAGNELCVRFGRRRIIAQVMLASALLASGIGFSAPLPYVVVATLALTYAALVQLDSAALTAGAMEAASPGQRGATLAVHGLIGFGCAGIGPLVLGMVLDATGGGSSTWSWGTAFASLGGVGLLGPIALRIRAER